MFYSNGYCNFPNLQIINLGSNFVNYFEDRFFCLDNLETLILDKNPVKQMNIQRFTSKGVFVYVEQTITHII
jgi:hypothetical protein